MNSPNRSRPIEVQVMGQSYLLACPLDQEAAFHAAIKKIDEQMCRIRDTGKIKARERIAVLAALNVAFDAELNMAQAAQTAQASGQVDDHALAPLIEKIEQALAQDAQRP